MGLWAVRSLHTHCVSPPPLRLSEGVPGPKEMFALSGLPSTNSGANRANSCFPGGDPVFLGNITHLPQEDGLLTHAPQQKAVLAQL